MHYILIICDGIADRALYCKKHRTPVMEADTPHLDMLASNGETGLVKTASSVMRADCYHFSMSLFGYDMRYLYSGIAAVDAYGSGINLENDDVVFNCSFVSLSDEIVFADKTMMSCPSDITDDERAELTRLLNTRLGNNSFTFKNADNKTFLVWKKGEPRPGSLSEPISVTGRSIGEYTPRGEFVYPLEMMMLKSYELLCDHPINRNRLIHDKMPVNCIWPWGEGYLPEISSFKIHTGLKAAMITNSDIMKGLAKCMDMKICNISDSSENEAQKAAEIADMELGSDCELICIYLTSPGYYSRKKDTEGKIKSISRIDSDLIAPLIESAQGKDYSLMLMSDLTIPVSTGIAGIDAVPYLLYRSNRKEKSSCTAFNEASAADGKYIDDSNKLFMHFIETAANA